MRKETLYNKKSKTELKKKLEKENFKRKTLSFYKYVELNNLHDLRNNIYRCLNDLNILGRIYIAKEGINAQISIPIVNIKKFKNSLKNEFNFGSLNFKIAVQDGTSFYKLAVKIKTEIVAYNISSNEYNMNNIGKHLDYREFNKLIDQGAIVLDMRNYYESEIGKFENAIIPDVVRSDELLPEVKKILKDNKDDKILLYCTGGIRCEKASSYLINLGFKDINQLSGGIIKYAHDIKKNNVKSKFIGKNFVFDNRMSESITDDVIGSCHVCSKSSDRHINCYNEYCHILLIQCTKCSKNLNNCCSKDCAEFLLLPIDERKKIFKDGKIKFNAQKTDKIRPKLKDINSL